MPKNAQADALLKKLRALAGSSPGDQPQILDEVRAMIAKWQGHSDAAIRGRADEAMRAFEDWLGIGKKWDRSADDGKHAHSVLTASIKRLHAAITADAWNG